ncbi:MAG: hypothetical protein H7A43_00560 [Verrucomicrobia bacterium]|nr:hypothetical protein [Kiritimatiellia bacterium]MCP5487119.1 hypothetical protein [Verrucomicrobiota bacterium]
MIYTRRDLNMVIAILLVLVGGLSYLIVTPQLESWREANRIQERLDREQDTARRLLDRRPEWEEALAGLRGQLPSFGIDQAVTAELLKQIKRLADENQLVLARIEPGEEDVVGDLHEVQINCAWEGELEPLVRFLYAVQLQGATLDIRQLTISPGREGMQLKGNFKVYYAFTRQAAVEEPGEAP